MIFPPPSDEDFKNFGSYVTTVCTDYLQHLSEREQQALRWHISVNWDGGAWRTVYWYFEPSPTFLIHHFLTSYFTRYFDRRLQKWTVHNPSAAAVALCREYF